MYLNPFVAYQEQKQLLVNQTNPFYQEPLPSPPPAPTLLPSPSAKSAISNGSSTSRSSNSLESSTSQHRESGKSSITAAATTATTRPTTTTTKANATTSTTINSKNTTTTTLTTTTNTNITNTLSSVNVVNNNNNNNTKNNDGTMANSNNKITECNNLKKMSECAILEKSEMETTPNSQHEQKPQHKSRKNMNSICPPTFNENIMAPALPPRLHCIREKRRALTPTPLPPPPPTPPQTMRSKSLTRNELKEHPVQTERSSISIDPNLQLNAAASSPNVLKRVLKRNNSYRLANEEMNKENMNANILPHLSLTDKSGSCTPQRSIAKSFERLMDQFSLSTTSIDSSYLKNKSLENFDEAGEAFVNNAETEANDSESDSDLEFIAPVTNSRYHKSFIENVLLRPFKIIKPHDEGARRQRILKKLEVTEIW